VLKVELVLAALLRRARADEALLGGVAQDRRAELLIHQDAGAVLGDATRHGGLEGVVDDLLDGGDLCRLFRAQRPLPAQYVLRKRGPMVKGQHVKGLVVTNFHGYLLIPWYVRGQRVHPEGARCSSRGRGLVRRGCHVQRPGRRHWQDGKRKSVPRTAASRA